MIQIACLLYNIVVLAGTAYLVGWQDWSPWWFVLALLALCGTKGSKA
jgi:hypothetical protein